MGLFSTLPAKNSHHENTKGRKHENMPTSVIPRRNDEESAVDPRGYEKQIPRRLGMTIHSFCAFAIDSGSGYTGLGAWRL